MDESFEVRRGHSVSVLICLIEHGTSGTEDHHLRVKGKRLVSAVSSLLLIQPFRELRDYGRVNSSPTFNAFHWKLKQ